MTPTSRATLPCVAAVVVSLLALGACGGGSGDKETAPERLPNAASLIPTAPAPQPTATPAEPPPSEDPWPANPGGGTGGTGGATSGSCGEPVPPPIATMAVGVHGGSGDRVLLDSTPLVGPDAAYCKRIGFTDGRSYCPVRPEGNPERVACEALRVGRAGDTGRVGPTWTVDGRPCDGKGDVTSCVNHPGNQFQAYAYGPGTFRACAAGGACGEIRLP